MLLGSSSKTRPKRADRWQFENSHDEGLNGQSVDMSIPALDAESRHESSSDPAANFSAPWRSLAYGALAVAVAALAALSVVSARQHADALATVALALAILSFVAQLLIATVQIAIATRQSADAQQVKSDTQGLLADTGATVRSVVAILSTQFDKVLSAALHDVAESVAIDDASAGVSPGQVPPAWNDLVRRLEDAVAVRSREVLPGFHASSSAPSAASLKLGDTYDQYPPEDEGRVAWQMLKQLDPREAAWLVKTGQRERDRVRQGLEPQLRYNEDQVKRNGAMGRGLAEATEPPEGIAKEPGDLWYRLSDSGRMGARLLISPLKPPDWLEELRDEGQTS